MPVLYDHGSLGSVMVCPSRMIVAASLNDRVPPALTDRLGMNAAYALLTCCLLVRSSPLA